ncbi:hypothetical protein FRC03_009801 [Tulasnella sp. 419]|nr:hypothetical protein FRC03_009801 [Tulasnella sp. 419]
MTSYHSAAYINPESSYGVVVLMAGRTGALEAFHHIVSTFQPAFDALLADRVSDLYVGIWRSEDEETSEVILEVVNGALKILRLKLNEVELLEASDDYPDGFVPIELWHTGRKDEFRIGLGLEKVKKQPLPSADPYFMGLDGPMAINGFPLNLMVFGYYKDARVMRVPSANAILRR